MIRWWHNIRRLWSRSEWFYITKIEWELPADDQMGPRVPVTYYYAACNTSGCPHWYEQRGRADTVHYSQIGALLKDLREDWDEIRVWTREEFDAETKELIAEECT